MTRLADIAADHGAPPAWREAYLAAYAIVDHDAAHAAMLLQKLMADHPVDPPVRRLTERLPTMRKSGPGVTPVATKS